LAGLAGAFTLLATCAWSPTAFAYEGEIHQQLTFIAARQYNQCVEETHLATLTPLQVRYIAIANANQAEAAWWRRMFRWNYYNRGDQSTSKLLWLVDTRMHNHFGATLRRLSEARDLSRRFTNLGRIINYLQDATTPAHVVPVYTTRWWRFSVSDRFNDFPVDADAVTAALGEDCTAIRGGDVGFENLLVATADRTIASVTEPIPGMPVTWEVFWELSEDADDFGRYGNAGNNFGRETRFRCNYPEDSRRKNCVLVEDDPLYRQYAQARHLDAVEATMSAMAMVQDAAAAIGSTPGLGEASLLAADRPTPRDQVALTIFELPTATPTEASRSK